MSKKLLSPDDVAGRLDIPSYTLRLWCTIFATRLSNGARAGSSIDSEKGTWAFTEEDVVILSKVRRLADRTVSAGSARGRLAR